ncbi:MAG: isochorismatase family protein, partial [Alphaproteobacteria bacterium]|nr:isochorismatase family protein [Alphaproteobacteria bacterium]
MADALGQCPEGQGAVLLHGARIGGRPVPGLRPVFRDRRLPPHRLFQPRGRRAAAEGARHLRSGGAQEGPEPGLREDRRGTAGLLPVEAHAALRRGEEPRLHADPHRPGLGRRHGGEIAARNTGRPGADRRPAGAQPFGQGDRIMASKDEFENHCWVDAVKPEDLLTYAPYARETFVGDNPALLVIDLYNLVYKGGRKYPHELEPDFPNSCGIYAHDAIEPTQRLIAGCRAAGLQIFYVTAQFNPHRVDSTRRVHLPMVAEDCEIHDAFAPRPEDIVFRKERPSAFFGTPLIAHLNQRRIDSLIVCGESTS